MRWISKLGSRGTSAGIDSEKKVGRSSLASVPLTHSHKITYIHQPRPLLQGAGGYLIPIVKRVTCAPNLIYGRTTDGINLKQHFLEIRASYPKRYIHDCGRSRPRRHGRRIHEFTLVLVLVLVLLFCLISVERTLLNPSYPRSPAFRSPRIRRRRGA